MDRFLKTEINKKLQEKAWREFLSQLKNIHSIKELDGIFDTLLSSDEELILKRRLAVRFLLKQNKRHKEISEILGVSRQTINAVKKSLLEKSYKTYRKRKRPEKISKSSYSYRTPTTSKNFSKFSTYKGKGRWRFLNM
ncbi:hypothetical protein AUJ30_00505 [Candidatus Wolfebacteria bacterium CG1_02_39_135]|uniref:Uncharacterized protein n=1 Tax=Candidatus Wolfebacteria bacterium CG1_02_39_135 TaxID=1805425 RepID=A0A1J4XXM2_9BACT|nr:MAG: hypothetical protein AUJ30_00505 [Candidatus Wolfebacteria bacterium CG1_02_39_135]